MMDMMNNGGVPGMMGGMPGVPGGMPMPMFADAPRPSPMAQDRKTGGLNVDDLIKKIDAKIAEIEEEERKEKTQAKVDSKEPEEIIETEVEEKKPEVKEEIVKPKEEKPIIHEENIFFLLQ